MFNDTYVKTKKIALGSLRRVSSSVHNGEAAAYSCYTNDSNKLSSWYIKNDFRALLFSQLSTDMQHEYALKGIADAIELAATEMMRCLYFCCLATYDKYTEGRITNLDSFYKQQTYMLPMNDSAHGNIASKEFMDYAPLESVDKNSQFLDKNGKKAGADLSNLDKPIISVQLVFLMLGRLYFGDNDGHSGNSGFIDKKKERLSGIDYGNAFYQMQCLLGINCLPSANLLSNGNSIACYCGSNPCKGVFKVNHAYKVNFDEGITFSGIFSNVLPDSERLFKETLHYFPEEPTNEAYSGAHMNDAFFRKIILKHSKKRSHRHSIMLAYKIFLHTVIRLHEQQAFQSIVSKIFANNNDVKERIIEILERNTSICRFFRARSKSESFKFECPEAFSYWQTKSNKLFQNGLQLLQEKKEKATLINELCANNAFKVLVNDILPSLHPDRAFYVSQLIQRCLKKVSFQSPPKTRAQLKLISFTDVNALLKLKYFAEKSRISATVSDFASTSVT